MGFLSDLLPRVRAHVSDPSYLDGLPAAPTVRAPSLRGAIERSQEGWALLVERKHESPGATDPSLPAIPMGQFVARSKAGGADGLSCIATTPEFRGSPLEVAELVRASGLPVLFKDFVVDPIQVEAAFRSGASAILLIARLQTEGFLEVPLRDLALASRARGLEVLLEVHGPEEWTVAEDVAGDVFGVNLRDLETLRIRPEAAEAAFRQRGNHRPLLGLSGVVSRADAQRFRRWGADGLLVGSGFARSADPSGFLQSLRVPRHE